MNSRSDLPRRRDVAAGVAAEVEDDLLAAGVDVGLERVVELARRVVREAGHADVADLAVGEVLAR